jgi:hypothetical protein
VNDAWMRFMVACICAAIADIYRLEGRAFAMVLWGFSATLWLANGIVTIAADRRRHRRPTWDDVYGRDR